MAHLHHHHRPQTTIIWEIDSCQKLRHEEDFIAIRFDFCFYIASSAIVNRPASLVYRRILDLRKIFHKFQVFSHSKWSNLCFIFVIIHLSFVIRTWRLQYQKHYIYIFFRTCPHAFWYSFCSTYRAGLSHQHLDVHHTPIVSWPCCWEVELPGNPRLQIKH